MKNLMRYNPDEFKSPQDKRLALEHERLDAFCRESRYLTCEVLDQQYRLPRDFLLTYRLRSIVGIGEDQSPVYGDQHQVRITLSAKYPLEPARCALVSPVWHPNIQSGGSLHGRVQLAVSDEPGVWSLEQIAEQIGDLLRYRMYQAEDRPPFPENAAAAKWVREYAEPKGLIAPGKGLVGQVASLPSTGNRMDLYSEIALENGRKIQLLFGDLAHIPEEHEVDLLVLSAFSDDYIPTSTSLIGALHRQGISVRQLAEDKEADLRTPFRCWLSKPVQRNHIGRILCFEPKEQEDPGSLISGIFQSIMPFAYLDEGIQKIAMPIVSTGDQGFASDYLFTKLLEAALFWLQKEVPFTEIKIVERHQGKVDRARQIMEQVRQNLGKKIITPFSFDYFISYSRKNSAEAEFLYQGLRQSAPHRKVFLDREEISVGQFWQNQLYDNLDACRYIIALLSGDYLQSQMCIEEYNIGRARNLDENRNVVLPVFLYSCDLPTYMKALQFHDAREGDRERIQAFCAGLSDQP